MTQKTLEVKLVLLADGFAKTLDKSVKGVLDSTKKLTKNIQTLGAKMSVALSVPATLLGKSLLKMAGDAEDASDKFSAVFGDSAPKVEKSIENLSKVFTRNTTDLKNYASEFGSMLTSMDLTEDEAGQLSRSMVQLGLDVASLRGIADEKVMDTFSKSLSGNTGALKELGFSISDTDVQLEAFNMGIRKSVSELTERDKALVIASLLQKTFSKDVGDASKSQKDWGEVLNQFNAKAKNLGEALGKELIPMVSSLADKIAPLIEYFINLDDSVKRGAMTVLVFAVLLPPLVTVLGTLGNILVVATGFLWSFIKGLAVAIASVIRFTAVLIVNNFSAFVSGVGLMAKGLLSFTMVAIPVVVIIGSLVQIIRMAIRFWAMMAGIVGDNAEVITRLFMPAVKLLLQGLERVIYTGSFLKNMTMGNGIDESMRLAMESTLGLNKTIGELKLILDKKAPNTYAETLTKNLYNVEKKLNETAENFDGMLLSVNQSVQNSFGETMDWISNKSKSAWDVVADTAKGSFGKALDFMKDMAIGSLALIGEFDPFKSSGKKSTSKGSTEALTDPKSMANGTFLADMGDISGIDPDENIMPVPEIPPQALTLWEDFAKHIEETMITTADIVKGAWDNVFNNFASGISGMILEGNSFAETFRNMFKSLADFVIQSIIKMGLQWLVTEMMKRTVSGVTSKIVQADAITTATIATTASVASSQTMIANNAIVAGSGAASSQASIPIIGPILAVGAMVAMIATVMALQGRLKLASGGITQGPTNALIGEKGREAVIPLDRLDSMMGNREQNIIFNLDSRTLARAVLKHSPREIRLSTGVIM